MLANPLCYHPGQGQRMRFDQLKRRRFIMLLGGAAAWSLAARAQQGGRVRRVGFLLSSAGMHGDVLAPLEVGAFVETLRKLGWIEGRNIVIVHRPSEGSGEPLQASAKELVSIAPDVIVTVGGPALQHVLAETRTIPIVFTVVSDPVTLGIVSNLAHPGGNTTGFSTVQDSELAGKWLELLNQMVAPRLARALAVMQANNPSQKVMRDTVAGAASSLGVTLVSADAQDWADYEHAIEAFAHEPGGGLVVLPNAITVRHAGEIHALASRYRLPAIYSYPVYAKTGGLISYGSDPVVQFPEAARYVDRILRGERPGDLPVQQPTKFELVVNLKTAKELGLEVPPTLLTRADEVIE